MVKPKMVPFAVMAVLALTGAPGSSHAVLNAVDPGPYTTAFGNFPRWYQDTHGKALELCLSTAVSLDPAAAGGLMCVLLPTRTSIRRCRSRFPAISRTNRSGSWPTEFWTRRPPGSTCDTWPPSRPPSRAVRW